MKYSETLDYIHSHKRFGNAPCLDRIKIFQEKLGNPQKDLKFIHIAGTNGKGSFSYMASNILIDAGYNVGLYISPYVTDFRERIQCNANMISQDNLCEIVESLIPVEKELKNKGIELTEFEFTTAVAMVYFKQKGCDIVVLETGLGGRFDATNVIDTPVMSVITHISLDHVAVLGKSIKKITFEKCGIIKENGTTVCYPSQHPDALEVIKNSCKEKNNELKIGCLEDIKILESTITYTNFCWNNLDIKLKLVGEHQILNTSTVITAMIEINSKGFTVTPENIKAGIEKTSIPARFEILSEKPLIILDGAHNADGINALVSTVEKLVPNKKTIFVLGTMRDKDYQFAIERVAKSSTEFVATTPSNSRSLFACNSMDIAKKYCKKTACIASPTEAINYAMYKAKAFDYILVVCGSLYLASEVRDSILKKSPLKLGLI